MKILLKLLGLAFLALLAIIIVVPLIFDPNDFKDDIETLVKDKTERQLNIEDHMELSLFPWIGIELGRVSLSNAQGFEPPHFAKIESAKIKVELWPLISKKVKIDTVTLYGLELNLQINKTGVSNWDDLTGTGTPETPPETSITTTTATAIPAGLLTINGIDIRDANILWQDDSTGASYKLHNINLNTGAIRLGEAFDITSGFSLQSNMPAVSGKIGFSSQLMLDVNNQSYQAHNTKLKIAMTGDILPGGELDATLNTDIDADLTKQIVKITNLHLATLNTTLTGDLAGKQIMDAPQFSGVTQIAEFNPRKLISQLGIEQPETTDPSVLNKASLTVKFDATTHSINIEKLDARIDDTKLTANAKIENFEAPAISFQAELDDIDLDRYMPPVDDATNTAVTPATATTAGALELPLEMLRELKLDGSLNIEKLKVSGLRSESISAKVKAHNGLINLSPVSAKLYGGSYQGNISLDARGNEPAFSFDEKLSQIQIEPFLKDLLEKDLANGKGDIQIKLNTRGATLDDLRKTLGGNISFIFVDGGIKGLNIIEEIKNEYTKVAKQLISDTKKLDATVFYKLEGAANIKNGFISIQTLVVDSAQLGVSGKGSADLVTAKLDLTLDVTPQGKFGDELGKLKGQAIPIFIKGTFTEPDIDYTSGLRKLLGRVAKDKLDQEKAKLKAELETQKADARKKLEEEQARIKQELEQKKAEEQKRLEEKAKEAIQNKLKGLFK